MDRKSVTVAQTTLYIEPESLVNEMKRYQGHTGQIFVQFCLEIKCITLFSLHDIFVV